MDEIEPQELDDDEVELHLVEEGGVVKSNALGHLATVTKTGYSVMFQRVYEVSGAMDDNSVDNATLLVVKISPHVNDPDRQFKGFSVSLTVKAYLPKGQWRNISSPAILSYEPAQEGVLYLKENTITQTETGTISGNASAQAPGGASLGFTASKSLTQEMKTRVLHSISARPDFGPGTDESPDKVTWTLSPAEKADGVGDYMVVAMLIKRARGSRFIIEVKTKGRLGFFHDKANAFSGHADTYLGPFPRPAKEGAIPLKTPSGVEANNLGATSSENLLQTLSFVHIPEKVAARQIYTKTSTTVETASANTTEAVPATDPKQMEEPLAKHEVEGSLLKGAITSNEAAASIKNAAPIQSADPVKNVSSFRSAGLVKNATAIAKPELYQSRSDSSSMKNARAIRLRKMAALYQRLAQLHREEAEELEGREESYVLGVEQEEFE